MHHEGVFLRRQFPSVLFLKEKQITLLSMINDRNPCITLQLKLVVQMLVYKWGSTSDSYRYRNLYFFYFKFHKDIFRLNYTYKMPLIPRGMLDDICRFTAYNSSVISTGTGVFLLKTLIK